MTTPTSDTTDSDGGGGEVSVFIADLNAARWVEAPGVVVLDRKWLRDNYGPHPASEETGDPDDDRTAWLPL